MSSLKKQFAEEIPYISVPFEIMRFHDQLEATMNGFDPEKRKDMTTEELLDFASVLEIGIADNVVKHTKNEHYKDFKFLPELVETRSRWGKPRHNLVFRINNMASHHPVHQHVFTFDSRLAFLSKKVQSNSFFAEPPTSRKVGVKTWDACGWMQSLTKTGSEKIRTLRNACYSNPRTFKPT